MTDQQVAVILMFILGAGNISDCLPTESAAAKALAHFLTKSKPCLSVVSCSKILSYEAYWQEVDELLSIFKNLHLKDIM